MHEASIAANLIHNVCGIAAQNNLCRVTEVRILIGRMHHIVPEVLQQQFRLQKKQHRLLARTRLLIKLEDIRIRCRACGAESLIREANFLCPACGGPDIEMAAGTEMHIIDIAGEK